VRRGRSLPHSGQFWEDVRRCKICPETGLWKVMLMDNEDKKLSSKRHVPRTLLQRQFFRDLRLRENSYRARAHADPVWVRWRMCRVGRKLRFCVASDLSSSVRICLVQRERRHWR
jgi:hypothetical protein